jgi:hypothetical protein
MRFAAPLALLWCGLACQQSQEVPDSGASTPDSGLPTYCTVSTSLGSAEGCNDPVMEVSSTVPDALATVDLSAEFATPNNPGGIAASASIEWVGHIPDHLTEVDSPRSVSLYFSRFYQACISVQACQIWRTTVPSEDGGTRLLPGASYTVNITSRVPTECGGFRPGVICTALHGTIQGVLVPTVDGGLDRGALPEVWTF